MAELKPCPYCKSAWIYASEYDYYSDYEAFGYRVKCNCGYAFKKTKWKDTKKEAIESWNEHLNTRTQKEGEQVDR